MIKVGVCGASGRMGHMNCEAVLNDERLTLSAALERKGHNSAGKDAGTMLGIDKLGFSVTTNVDEFLDSCDAVIDFTAPEATLNVLESAAERGIAYVIGTTGLTDEEKKTISDYAKKAPVVQATNMNVGVNVLFALVQKAAAMLGSDYEVEIIEAHHNKKKDSPSGTALSLAEAVAKEYDIELNDEAVYGRQGIVGERTKSEIGIHAVRAADIIGEHTVMFCRTGERIELTHRSHSRKGYALGAAQAVKWLIDNKKENGVYTMRDVLGI